MFIISINSSIAQKSLIEFNSDTIFLNSVNELDTVSFEVINNSNKNYYFVNLEKPYFWVQNGRGCSYFFFFSSLYL